jgi:ABC-2 type transport system permease protein
MLVSVVGVFVMFVPVYFVTGALQPFVQDAIQAEGANYFAFVIVGIVGTYLFSVSMAALPGALGGAISSGTLEALLVTRTPLYQVLIGFTGYGMVWSTVRALLLIGGAVAVGAQFVWSGAPLAAGILLVMMAAYFAFGLIAGALVLVFRTSGPFVAIVMMGTGLLGGVYYPTTAIPSWIENLSVLVPATYALRAVRDLVLNGAPFGDVARDVAVLFGYTAVLLALASVTFVLALRYARAAGTLSQY